MAIDGIVQPEIIEIDPCLRLKKYTDDCAFALDWYQDEETLLLIDGVNNPYNMEKVYQMYHYLQNKGEVYFIEVKPSKDSPYVPIGDVSFWQNDMPIIIGNLDFRGKAIGTRVVKSLIERAQTLNFSYLEVNEIFDYNIACRKLFQGFGFQAVEATKKGHRYRLTLQEPTR